MVDEMKRMVNAGLDSQDEEVLFDALTRLADRFGWELTKREGADDPDYVRPLATDEADAFLSDLNGRLTEQRKEWDR